MAALAQAGVAEFSWLRAERQTAGRGRLQRTWESNSGNLHCSTIVRLQPTDPLPPTLALVAALAVHDMLSGWLPGRLAIKWPNDIMAGKAKLAGMLLERADDAVVIGIGVNVTGAPANLRRPVTSLWQLGAVDADASALLSGLMQTLPARVRQWRGPDGLACIRNDWAGAALPIDTPMSVTLPNGDKQGGTFAGLAGDGGMMLRLANGDVHVMHAGDAFIL